jgi:RNA 2',3'-cyclic 3'-phosphodiesterase
VRSSVSRPPEPGAVRAFLAAALDDATRRRLDRLSSGWRERFPGVRLVPPANAHVTLRFLGPATDAQLDRVAALVAPAAAACRAAAATASGLAAFPPRGAPRVLALALALPAQITALQEACEAAARSAGFEPEPRAFRAHLTLGRWSRRVPRPPLPPVEPFAVPLDRVVLYRSDAGPAGVVYTALATFPLAG